MMGKCCSARGLDHTSGTLRRRVMECWLGDEEHQLIFLLSFMHMAEQKNKEGSQGILNILKFNASS